MAKQTVKRSEINTSVSMILLESYRNSLYAIKNFFDNASANFNTLDIETQIKVTKAVLEAGEKIGKNIESLDKLESTIKEKIAMASDFAYPALVFEKKDSYYFFEYKRF